MSSKESDLIRIYKTVHPKLKELAEKLGMSETALASELLSQKMAEVEETGKFEMKIEREV